MTSPSYAFNALVIAGRLRRSMLITISVILLLMFRNAIAVPAPMVRVEVAAPQPIRVGQQVSVDVTVLAPNFFMSAPTFPALDVPGAIVTLPDARALNGTQSIDGVTFATISKTYAFVAAQDGDFDLPQATIALTYAGNDGAPQQATVTLPATRIRVGAGGVPKGSPDDVQSGGPSGGVLLPVVQLNVTQTLSPAPDHDVVQLKVGDTLVRTVATFAPGTQAMLIRPPKLDAPRRVRVFAADPKLSDGVTPSSGTPTTGGLRIDTFSYVFERKGTYTLPAIALDWTDPATGRVSHSDAPAIRVVVATGASAGALTPGTGWSNLSLDAESIGGVLAGVAGLAVLGLVIWRIHSRWHTVRRRHDEGSDRGRPNAKSLHAEVIQACRAGDAVAAYRLAQNWSEDVTGHGLAAWAQTTRDVPLIDAVSTLERRLFAQADDAAGQRVWDGGPLAMAFSRCAATATQPVRRDAPSFLAPLNTF